MQGALGSYGKAGARKPVAVYSANSEQNQTLTLSCNDIVATVSQLERIEKPYGFCIDRGLMAEDPR